ncbi:hypothetical protein IJX73_00115 [bacterium]|nr:hypothetical protein [bacterium]MBQ9149314.1 hypothetical protein [bacterium]
MTTNTANKNNALHILKFLDSGEISRDDLLCRLNIKLSTFYKHLKTIKESGFDIEYTNNAYQIANFKNRFKFAKYELSVFGYLLLISNTMLPEYKSAEFTKALMKMVRFSDEEDFKEIEKRYQLYRKINLTNDFEEKINLLNSLIKNNEKIKITTKKGEELILKPKEINIKKENLYLNYTTLKNNTETIALDNIVKIMRKTFNKKNGTKQENETIFELYGKLAKSYLLREEERIIDSTKDKIVVASSNPDKTNLFRRLLRYDVLCKITHPKNHANNFREMIEKSLANLEENQEDYSQTLQKYQI